jgi:hypothetical protein
MRERFVDRRAPYDHARFGSHFHLPLLVLLLLLLTVPEPIIHPILTCSSWSARSCCALRSRPSAIAC